MNCRVPFLCVLVSLVACSDELPSPSINIECHRPQDDVNVDIKCGDENIYGDDTDPRVDARTFCASYPGYSGQDDACKSVVDCPLPTSPCETPQCVNGICSAAWLPTGSLACGDPSLSCMNSQCCGVFKENAVVECENAGQCPTPLEIAPNCKQRACWLGRCITYAFTAAQCDQFD